MHWRQQEARLTAQAGWGWVAYGRKIFWICAGCEGDEHEQQETGVEDERGKENQKTLDKMKTCPQSRFFVEVRKGRKGTVGMGIDTTQVEKCVVSDVAMYIDAPPNGGPCWAAPGFCATKEGPAPPRYDGHASEVVLIRTTEAKNFHNNDVKHFSRSPTPANDEPSILHKTIPRSCERRKIFTRTTRRKFCIHPRLFCRAPPRRALVRLGSQGYKLMQRGWVLPIACGRSPAEGLRPLPGVFHSSPKAAPRRARGGVSATSTPPSTFLVILNNIFYQLPQLRQLEAFDPTRLAAEVDQLEAQIADGDAQISDIAQRKGQIAASLAEMKVAFESERHGYLSQKQARDEVARGVQREDQELRQSSRTPTQLRPNLV